MELAETLRQRVKRGETLLGTFLVAIRTPAVADVLRIGGFDYVLIDREHGYYDNRDMVDLIRACRSVSLCPIVRLPGPDRGSITCALDSGAEGVMIAMVRSLDQARAAVNASKYPPLGSRGVHMLRPHTDFQPPSDQSEYLARANRSFLTAVQIETLEAVDLVDEIAAMEGVDMLYVGPADLSVAMGRPGAGNADEVIDAAVRVGRACRKHGKIAGCHLIEPGGVQRLRAEGFSLFGHAAALRMLQSGVHEVSTAFRKTLAHGRNAMQAHDISEAP